MMRFVMVPAHADQHQLNAAKKEKAPQPEQPTIATAGLAALEQQLQALLMEEAAALHQEEHLEHARQELALLHAPAQYLFHLVQAP